MTLCRGHISAFWSRFISRSEIFSYQRWHFCIFMSGSYIKSFSLISFLLFSWSSFLERRILISFSCCLINSARCLFMMHLSWFICVVCIWVLVYIMRRVTLMGWSLKDRRIRLRFLFTSHSTYFSDCSKILAQKLM